MQQELHTKEMGWTLTISSLCRKVEKMLGLTNGSLQPREIAPLLVMQMEALSPKFPKRKGSVNESDC